MDACWHLEHPLLDLPVSPSLLQQLHPNLHQPPRSHGDRWQLYWPTVLLFSFATRQGNLCNGFWCEYQIHYSDFLPWALRMQTWGSGAKLLFPSICAFLAGRILRVAIPFQRGLWSSRTCQKRLDTLCLLAKHLFPFYMCPPGQGQGQHSGKSPVLTMHTPTPPKPPSSGFTSSVFIVDNNCVTCLIRNRVV